MSTLLLAVVAALPLLFVPDAAYAQKTRDLTFVSLDTSLICTDCSVVQASGEFTENTIKAYYDLVWRSRFKKHIYFVFDSLGGSMKAAIRLGEILRTLRVNTIVGRAVLRNGEVEIEPARCASACVFAFLGGATRSMPQASRIGVHSWMPTVALQPEGGKPREKAKPLNRDFVEDMHRETALYLRYIDMMGVDLRLSVLILGTPYTSISWVSPRDQQLWGLVTIDSRLSTPMNRRWPILFLPRSAGPLPAPLKQTDARQFNLQETSV